MGMCRYTVHPSVGALRHPVAPVWPLDPLAQTHTSPNTSQVTPNPVVLLAVGLDLPLPPASSPSCSLTHRDTIKHPSVSVDPQAPQWPW